MLFRKKTKRTKRVYTIRIVHALGYNTVTLSLSSLPYTRLERVPMPDG